MISNQQSLNLSPFMAIYDIVVPKDNRLRQINDRLDFSFVHDITPEDEVINPSSLTKFRKLRLKDVNLLDMLIQITVEIALEKEISMEKSKLLRKAVYQIDKKMKDKLLPIHRHGYDVASSSGLIGMQMQSPMAIFSVNLKRIITLMKESK